MLPVPLYLQPEIPPVQPQEIQLLISIISKQSRSPKHNSSTETSPVAMEKPLETNCSVYTIDVSKERNLVEDVDNPDISTSNSHEGSVPPKELVSTMQIQVEKQKFEPPTKNGGVYSSLSTLNQSGSFEKKRHDEMDPPRWHFSDSSTGSSSLVDSKEKASSLCKPEVLLPQPVPRVFQRPPISFMPSSPSLEHKLESEMDFPYHGTVLTGYHSYGVPTPLHPLYHQYHPYFLPSNIYDIQPQLLPFILETHRFHPLFPRQLFPANSLARSEEYFRYYHTTLTPSYGHYHPQQQTHPVMPSPVPYPEPAHPIIYINSVFSGPARHEASKHSNVPYDPFNMREYSSEHREQRKKLDGKEIQVSSQTRRSAIGSPDRPHPCNDSQQHSPLGSRDSAPTCQSKERRVAIETNVEGQPQEGRNISERSKSAFREFEKQGEDSADFDVMVPLNLSKRQQMRSDTSVQLLFPLHLSVKSSTPSSDSLSQSGLIRDGLAQQGLMGAVTSQENGCLIVEEETTAAFPLCQLAQSDVSDLSRNSNIRCFSDSSTSHDQETGRLQNPASDQADQKNATETSASDRVTLSSTETNTDSTSSDAAEVSASNSNVQHQTWAKTRGTRRTTRKRKSSASSRNLRKKIRL